MPPESPASPVSAERALRILPIAANLLPVEIIESRNGRKVRRAVLAALVAFVLVMAGWYALATVQTVQARADLTGAQDDARRLQHQQGAFSDVVTTQAQSDVISTQLSLLLAQDLPWSDLLSSLQSAAPADVQLTGITGAMNPSDTAAGKGSKVITLPTTSDQKLVGALSIQGIAASKAAVAAYVDALAKVKGLANPLLGDATIQDGKLTFTVKVDITEAALGGRFAAKSSKGSGDN
jgi:Tfp pilus assembly protein PilN